MWVYAAVWVVVVGVWVDANTLTRKDLTRPDRIVGGDPVEKGDLPWQVSLQRNGHHFCGGTLIAENVVVTAAHCAKMDKNSFRIVTGAWDLRQPFRKYKIDKIVSNDYDSKSFANDIALLFMGELEGGAAARDLPSGTPVAVESRKEYGANENCIVSGWGRLKEGSDLPNILMAAEVPLKSDEDCRKMFSSYRYDILNTNLCAGGGSKDACQGDSGGPLVCCGDTSDIASCRLAGITSWGVGCATPKIPGVYTEVAHYRDWITKTLKDHGLEDRAVKFYEDEE